MEIGRWRSLTWTVCLYDLAVKMITGDSMVIAKETERVLGMGLRIYPRAQVPHRRDAAAGRLPLWHDGRWRQRRTGAQTR